VVGHRECQALDGMAMIRPGDLAALRERYSLLGGGTIEALVDRPDKIRVRRQETYAFTYLRGDLDIATSGYDTE